jgi:hypothetical protein
MCRRSSHGRRVSHLRLIVTSPLGVVIIPHHIPHQSIPHPADDVEIDLRPTHGNPEDAPRTANPLRLAHSCSRRDCCRLTRALASV